MQIEDLPTLNAALNALASVFLVTAYVFIRRGRRELHKRFMLAALVTSALFLASYVTYHANAGSRPFPGARPAAAATASWALADGTAAVG